MRNEQAERGSQINEGKDAGQDHDLVLTGERTLPGIWHENYWFRRHEAAYLAAAQWTVGAVVLDAGPGEGYGAALLARRAHRVVCVERDEAALVHLRRRYGRAVGGVRGDLHLLPLRDSAVDVVVTLQVIEHLDDQTRFVSECARVLRPSGTLLLTTPNRLTFSPGRDRPLNPFHTRELNARELRELLEPQFAVTRLWGVHHGHRLRRTARLVGGDLGAAQLKGAPEEWSRQLRRAVARVRAADFTVSARDVDASLDLFAVAVRRP